MPHNDRRTDQLTPNTVYCVYKPDGKNYRVYSKMMLDRLIERGEITEEHRVVLQRVNS
jgi:hypothetical protein